MMKFDSQLIPTRLLTSITQPGLQGVSVALTQEDGNFYVIVSIVLPNGQVVGAALDFDKMTEFLELITETGRSLFQTVAATGQERSH
jgi:hypothetical protein